MRKTKRSFGTWNGPIWRAVKRALKDLNWRPTSESKYRIVGHVPFRIHVIFFTYGAKLTVDVEDEMVYVRSEASFVLEWIDLGQHAENIKNFLNALKDALRD